MSAATMPLMEDLENYDYLRRPIKSHERSPGKIPYLGASGEVDRVEGFTHEGDFLCVSEDGENLRSRRTPIAWVQRGQFWANNHLHVLGGASVARLRFLAAAVAWTDISGYLTGSAQPKLSQASLARVEIPRFTHSEQEAIGEVLGALDDKIAANHRLQSLAIDQISALARAAASTVRLGEVASLHRNSLAPRSFGAENVWHYSLPSFDEGRVRLEASSGIMSAKHRLDRPVVLVSKLNPRIPRVWPVMRLKEGVSVTSPEFMAMAPTQGFSVASLTAALRSEQFTTSLLSLVAGTTGSHQRVKPMEVMELGIPDMRTLSRAALETIEALELMSVSSSEENTTLARTRDELLPQLMSGCITVKDAEKRVEEEV